MKNKIKIKLFLERAENEFTLAKAIFFISKGKSKSDLNIPLDMTFYSSVINHSYYCIFYSAKAILLKNNIETKMPSEHKKTLRCFKELVKKGFIDKELLKIYNEISLKANELLGIFSKEKSKRGKFTYQKLPQANIEPAKESLVNSEKFFKSIYNIINNDTI